MSQALARCPPLLTNWPGAKIDSPASRSDALALLFALRDAKGIVRLRLCAFVEDHAQRADTAFFGIFRHVLTGARVDQAPP